MIDGGACSGVSRVVCVRGIAGGVEHVIASVLCCVSCGVASACSSTYCGLHTAPVRTADVCLCVFQELQASTVTVAHPMGS